MKKKNKRVDDVTENLQQTAAVDEPVMNAVDAVGNPVGTEQIKEATTILNKYQEGKANLEERVVDNEQWFKLRHAEITGQKKSDEINYTSAWLLNCILNKHADAMDNFPSPNILPREEGDVPEAEKLSSILPVILDQCEFEQVYSDVWFDKLKSGTGIYGVFWDSSKHNGLGDIAIKPIDITNIHWEPGILDIQKSRNLFYTELVANDVLIELYPQLNGKLGATAETTKYRYDDNVDTSDKSMVVEWYYKRVKNGKNVLHYCKYVNDEVLYASENDPVYSERGFYDHGDYPFVFDTLNKVKGSPAGFGYIDIGKSPQKYIDLGNKFILENLFANTKPRFFVSCNGAVNEAEYADMNNSFVHVTGQITENSILPINGKPLNSIYVNVLNDRIDEMKETTGNRDISNGGTTSGVTAASAIAAMQEAGSKLSRDDIKASYRTFRKISLMVIELIRQFYDEPRNFRILGQNGMAQFISYDNKNVVVQQQEPIAGEDMGFRKPIFDIEVTAQKASPYSKLSQNELALQFYGAGFFNPQLSDQALACVEMMDFDRKDMVIQKIQANGTMYQTLMNMQQQMLQLGAMVDAMNGSNEITAALYQQFGISNPGYINGAPTVQTENAEALGGESSVGESGTTKKARQRVANATTPN